MGYQKVNRTTAEEIAYQKAMIEEEYQDGYKPNVHTNKLMYAIRKCSLKHVQQILKEEPELLYQTNDMKENVIHIFAKSNNSLDMITIIDLIKRPELLEARDVYGYTPLLRAASDGKPRILEILLASGCDVRARDSNGRSVLHMMAIKKKFYSNAFLVIKLAGIHIDDTDNNGDSPLSLMGHCEFNSCDDYFCRTNDDIDTIKKWLGHGANINHQNHEGHTFLHNYIRRRDMYYDRRIVEFMIQCGADINIRDQEGLRPHDTIRSYCNLL